MHQSALLIREGKTRSGIARLQDGFLKARLRQICERLVDEGEGLRRPVPRARRFERVELGGVSANRLYGFERFIALGQFR
jgi:hypothetical protein